MHCFEVYQDAFQYALHSKTFALAHLHRLRLPMSIDTTGCCKLFYFTSGSKSFHIDQWQFSVEPGDLFWINQNQWHYFSQADSHVDHDRYVLFIHPAFLKSLSTEQTDLSAGFSSDFVPGCRLNEDQQQQMAKLLEALATAQGFGEDVLQLAKQQGRQPLSAPGRYPLRQPGAGPNPARAAIYQQQCRSGLVPAAAVRTVLSVPVIFVPHL